MTLLQFQAASDDASPSCNCPSTLQWTPYFLCLTLSHCLVFAFLSQGWLAWALTIIQFHLALYGIAPGRWLKNQALNPPVPFASSHGQVLWNAMELR